MMTEVEALITRMDDKDEHAVQVTLVTLVLQFDELDRAQRHLKLWVLVLALLLLAMAILVVELWKTVG